MNSFNVSEVFLKSVVTEILMPHHYIMKTKISVNHVFIRRQK